MKYHELDVKKNRKTNRVGRGIAHGQGKTAGRGTKGQNSRTGSSRKPGFEGGSNPLMQRLPKLRGFNSKKVKDDVIYTGDLDSIGAKLIDNHAVFKAGLVESPYTRVKLIVNGEVKKPLNIKLQGASKSAVNAVMAAGGTVIPAEQIGRPSKGVKE
jgi:large subunit ribosomal protein L15